MTGNGAMGWTGLVMAGSRVGLEMVGGGVYNQQAVAEQKPF